MESPSTLERAFELARSGRFENLAAIRKQLKRDGHAAVDQHLSGPSITRQLGTIIKETRAQRAD